jgi:methionyl-tRNA formyltransferase
VPLDDLRTFLGWNMGDLTDKTSSALRIVFMGTSVFACPTLTALVERGHRVVGVFTQPDRAQGRGQQVRTTAVKGCALGHGLMVYQPERINKEEGIAALEALAPEVIVVAAYGQILSPRILGIPSRGCINVHASLLPKYRGAAPINWAIIRGEQATGVTTMLMDEGLDTGDVLLQQELEILSDEDAGQLHDRLAVAGATLLIATLERLGRGELAPEPQDQAHATYAPLLKKEDGLIAWERAAMEIHNQVRGLYPWPGAFTYLEERLLKVFRTQVIAHDSDREPGTVLEASDAGLLVKTGRDSLLVREVQQQDRKRMPAAQFVRGCKVGRGTRLGDITRET